ncbi:ABC transporter ATP-binding protein [Halegenticoccus soli]|uniref:ABC transporter ATP-binding protein n=1 Tax=Halegenticoccus soli TaxID=1985678 RepID=UPI000C6CC899|nr:ABC transporter ATP-binding protein [Halegenticoccus soli]
MPAVEMTNLTKRYGDVTALDSLSLSVADGEVFGFLGPNGAGKSTAINAMLDFVRPTSGSVSVFGLDARAESVAVRERTGVLPEGYDVYPELTGREHLEHVIAVKGAGDDPDDLLARVDLEGAANRAAGGYSKGMRQRLAIAAAIVGEPDLLVLDEPSSGLDPNGGRRLREIVREENERGATVFLSSHILDEVEAVCDRIGILFDGRLVTDGSVAELRAELAADATLTVAVERVPDGLLAELEAVRGVTGIAARAGRVVVECRGGEAKFDALRRVRRSDAGFVDFTTDDPSLGEVFSEYTTGGRSTRRNAGEPVSRRRGARRRVRRVPPRLDGRAGARTSAR